jgi:hypothetical protein
LLTLEDFFLAGAAVVVALVVVVVFLTGAAVVVFLAGAEVVTDFDLAVVLDWAPAFRARAAAHTISINFKFFMIVGFKLNNRLCVSLIFVQKY